MTPDNMVKLATSGERGDWRHRVQTFAQSEALRLAMKFGSVSDEGRQELRVAYARALVREAKANAEAMILARTSLRQHCDSSPFTRAFRYLFRRRG